MVNYFSNLEIWVKHHPRNVFKIPIEDYIKKNRLANIKEFGNYFDTNILLANADICISAASTTFISPILQRKPVICYNGWKEICNVPSIFDNLDYMAASEEELLVQYNKIINRKYSINEDTLKQLYINVFSSDYLFESMTEKYSANISDILKS